jgi:hypothetical protein
VRNHCRWLDVASYRCLLISCLPPSLCSLSFLLSLSLSLSLSLPPSFPLSLPPSLPPSLSLSLSLSLSRSLSHCSLSVLSLRHLSNLRITLSFRPNLLHTHAETSALQTQQSRALHAPNQSL